MACLETAPNLSDVESVTLIEESPMDDRFSEAYPESVPSDLFIRDDFTALNGRWREWRKKKSMAMAIMARLGVGAIKRRLVASRSNEYDLTLALEDLLIEPEGDVSVSAGEVKLRKTLSSAATATADAPKDDGVLGAKGAGAKGAAAKGAGGEDEGVRDKEADVRSPPRGEGSFEQTGTGTSEGVTTAGTPLESPKRRASLSNVSSRKGIKGVLVTYFPLKRVLTNTFVADGEQMHVANDPETGDWDSIAIYRDGMLMHRRTSPKHPGITLYETRAILPPHAIIFKTEPRNQPPTRVEAAGGVSEGISAEVVAGATVGVEAPNAVPGTAPVVDQMVVAAVDGVEPEGNGAGHGVDAAAGVAAAPVAAVDGVAAVAVAAAAVAAVDGAVSDDEVTTMTPPPLTFDLADYNEVYKLKKDEGNRPVMYFQWKMVDTGEGRRIRGGDSEGEGKGEGGERKEGKGKEGAGKGKGEGEGKGKGEGEGKGKTGESKEGEGEEEGKESEEEEDGGGPRVLIYEAFCVYNSEKAVKASSEDKKKSRGA